MPQDATLKRCFGVDKKIIDCKWEYIRTLRTTREPAEPMPRLKELLEYLVSPGLEEIWVLLDIKVDNASDDVFRLIARTLDEVAPSPKRAWRERVLMGCWGVRIIQSYLITLVLILKTDQTTKTMYTAPSRLSYKSYRL